MTRIGESIIKIFEGLDFIPGIGAEIGVWQGETSAKLLSKYPELKLYMVDIWGDKSNYSGEKEKQIAKKVVKPFGHRAVILHGSSVRMSQVVENGSLDFVFIDANHSYKSVKEDNEVWYPKVCVGGYIMGHDYLNPKRPGVKRAVDELYGDSVFVCSDGGETRLNDYPEPGVHSDVDCGIWYYRKEYRV